MCLLHRCDCETTAVTETAGIKLLLPIMEAMVHTATQGPLCLFPFIFPLFHVWRGVRALSVLPWSCFQWHSSPGGAEAAHPHQAEVQKLNALSTHSHLV